MTNLQDKPNSVVLNTKPIIEMKGINSTSANLLRVTAIFAVIVIHTCSLPFKSNSENWDIFNFFTSLSRWCVPVLFMLTGALLIEKDESIVTFFKKRAGKILIPLAAWSFIYIVFAKNFSYLDPLHANPGVFTEPFKLLEYPAYFHLWFLYAIIGVYIAIPLLRAAFSKYSNKLAIYVLSMWFVSISLIPYLNASGIIIPKLYIIRFDLLATYTGMSLLGLFILKNINRINIVHSLALLVIGLAATIILTKHASIKAPSELYQGYNSPNVLLMATGAFATIYKIGEVLKNVSFNRCLEKLSNLSFGIYLAHMIIMPFVWKIPFLSNSSLIVSNMPSVAVIISATATFLLSYFISYFISLTPVIRRII
ncbi:acyltransferase [Escherichia coli]|nr:acyltransferase [Escherichia coli]EFO5872695.1 acyltransferase [Escherichia coli]EGG0346430.1 acyltransferase [Escherichia coli]EHA3975239.1 acyltransferase [Escherichia coli]EHP4428051.1 acyltransferase [Escherichia coli]